MPATDEPTCSRCPNPADCKLADEALCAFCADDVLAPIRERVAARAAEQNQPRPEPPVALDAERILLGSMLADAEVATVAIAADLWGTDFVKPAHRQIYDQIREAVLAGAEMQVKLGDEFGGSAYLDELWFAGDDTWPERLTEVLTVSTERRRILEEAAADSQAADDARPDVTDGSAFAGHGRQDGPLRLDYGPDWAWLRCDRCSATWVGVLDESCGWCARSLELLMEAQRAVLLDPDLPDPSDARRGEAEVMWARRLARSVKAGIVDERTARRALDRCLAKPA